MHVTKIETSDWSAVTLYAFVNKVAVIVAWGVLLTYLKAFIAKRKILQIYMFICISIPKHNTCNVGISGC